MQDNKYGTIKKDIKYCINNDDKYDYDTQKYDKKYKTIKDNSTYIRRNEEKCNSNYDTIKNGRKNVDNIDKNYDTNKFVRKHEIKYETIKNNCKYNRRNHDKYEKKYKNKSINKFDSKYDKNNEIIPSETYKENDMIIHNNNVIIDISKKERVEKIYHSNINRKDNYKANLLDCISQKECEICHKKIYSHLYSIHYNAHPTEIFSWLYLGTFDNACDIEELRRIKVTHVLNCAIECKNETLPKDIKELHLNIHDYEGFELFEFFEKANDFMKGCKINGGVVLVHCKYGISRSVAFVIAYLIKYMKYTVDYAIKFLMDKRKKIKPNEGFLEQLYKYEEHYLGKKC
jgi:protein-tyrosine phosphatase